ncbi:tRNA (adenosine(37)-N6)-dimethylallyltransferase MiaA [Deinococcus rubellus]|uniref:tRNA dimethylallyltransferase n=1 Tax=Deinococcus rubellus TaxID=1889240 RepID=A0ABY5YDH7_9DEIO|nr:tRNA (adenosine(37)-N6)-dimethylallyltransferase MiaA [Deinococcus rubellus]UWX63094.1 tRNA (adenosine(37)-N6)-dimethylallyltransferase MiaA [Deinococcus rubellus]
MLPILTAPTAAGKTALALRLARQFPLEIVAADAFTVYKGLDIGTAKPTPAERREVSHHLLDVVDVTDPFDVAQWLKLAEQAAADILGRGRVPLIVGGSGFYLKALVRGLPLTPPSDPQARAGVEAELAERGLDALIAEIAARNPPEAARMERNPRRVVRALEIFRRTGRFPGEFGHSAPAHCYQVLAFSQPDLEARIRQRVHAMLGAGWPEEAAWLAEQVAPDQAATVWQALGYREALAVARQQLGPQQAAEQIVLQTRQYAKRQLTWARTQLGAAVQTEREVETALQAFLSLVR